MIDLLHMILGNALHGSNDDACHADDGGFGPSRSVFQRVENLDHGFPERVRRAVSETMMRHVSAA